MRVGISEDRVEKLRNQCVSLKAQGARVRRKDLRQLAGLAAWLATLMPQLKPFTAMLWAAMYSTKEQTVHANQVRLPIHWLLTFANANFLKIERRVRKPAAYSTVLTFDGSLSGGGATLQVGVPSLENADEHPIVAYWHDEWGATDRARLQVVSGESAGQARLEAYTLHLSLHIWRQILAESEGKLVIIGDALGILHDALKLRAKDTVLNSLLADSALILAPMGLHISGAHLWSQRNKICDALSRMKRGSQPPERLKTVVRVAAKRPTFHVLGSTNE